MTPSHSRPETAGLSLAEGTVAPAHPLALDAAGAVDWTSQRALTRYYLDAGAHALAVGVHTTQFALHDDPALLADVWADAAAAVAESARPASLIAGVRGTRDEARTEAETAAGLGYDAALLSPPPGASDTDILELAASVGEVLPVIGFYMQDDVGGRYLGPAFWRSLFEQPTVIAVKVAAFDRYRTGEVVRALFESGRSDVVLLTGNDDNIIADLTTTYGTDVDGTRRSLAFRGGLLGQWAVGTRAAVELSTQAVAARTTGTVPGDLLTSGTWLTEINSAVFDVRNTFAGCVAGVNEVLRQQGLITTNRCLDLGERLSPGQEDAIRRMRLRYPELLDERFVEEHVDRWRS